jgi:hypothetical protein
MARHRRPVISAAVPEPTNGDQLAGLRIVFDRALHALDRLLRAVIALVILSAGSAAARRIHSGDLPHRRLLAITGPKPRLAFAHRVPARLMLPMIVAPADGERRFRPRRAFARRSNREPSSPAPQPGLTAAQPAPSCAQL